MLLEEGAWEVEDVVVEITAAGRGMLRIQVPEELLCPDGLVVWVIAGQIARS